eukprot:993498-Rhodomonas_salina.1
MDLIASTNAVRVGVLAYPCSRYCAHGICKIRCFFTATQAYRRPEAIAPDLLKSPLFFALSFLYLMNRKHHRQYPGSHSPPGPARWVPGYRYTCPCCWPVHPSEACITDQECKPSSRSLIKVDVSFCYRKVESIGIRYLRCLPRAFRVLARAGISTIWYQLLSGWN